MLSTWCLSSHMFASRVSFQRGASINPCSYKPQLSQTFASHVCFRRAVAIPPYRAECVLIVVVLLGRLFLQQSSPERPFVSSLVASTSFASFRSALRPCAVCVLLSGLDLLCVVQIRPNQRHVEIPSGIYHQFIGHNNKTCYSSR